MRDQFWQLALLQQFGSRLHQRGNPVQELNLPHRQRHCVLRCEVGCDSAERVDQSGKSFAG
jgi:hypothetical protein